MKRATLLHLRIPFSFFLLPVFLFAWSIKPYTEWWLLVSTFVILHFLLYPASNGYNSYFDKDEESIGGLKHPPKVSLELYRVALIMDVVALVWGLLINWEFALMLFVYGMVSKAYSHPSVRLKKMPYIGWLAAGIFQGYFTFLMAYMGMHDEGWNALGGWEIQIPAILSTVLLFGSYPMTQVYQHEEDGRRGDETISRKLGILGTFHFTAAAFAVASGGFVYYFVQYYTWTTAFIFLGVLTPVLIFFTNWYFKVRQNVQKADFTHTMQLNLLSSLMFNLFFSGMAAFSLLRLA
ncbi:MAG: UbiA family prenyltransferase [Bacteroidota bacterium]